MKKPNLIWPTRRSAYGEASLLEKLTFAWVKPFVARVLKGHQKVWVADLGEINAEENIGREVDKLNERYILYS